jgi:hypothetical protein
LQILRPPQGTIGGEAAYKLRTVTGETFWLILPDELSGGDVFAGPSVPISLHTALSPRIGLTATAPDGVALRYCGIPRCRPQAIAHKVLANGGQLTRWTDAGEMMRDLGLTTVRFDEWTLILSDGTEASREAIAGALTWHVDPDGFIQLASSDPQVAFNRNWAEVFVFVRDPAPQDYYNELEILPGCRLAEKQPDLGGSNAGPTLDLHEEDAGSGGRWCAGDKFWVDASWADGQRLGELYEKVRVVPAPA